MNVVFRPLQRCEMCEHGSDHACQLLMNEVRAAVAEANCRATRHGLQMPEGCEIVLSCPSFWRRGRSHG